MTTIRISSKKYLQRLINEKKPLDFKNKRSIIIYENKDSFK